MPGVSDPGLRLVRAAREAGAPVEVLPGASACATAYVASGCTCPRFYFGGFFPRKDVERKAALDALRTLDAALIFYESTNRVASALESMAQAFPLREAAVCRELTKLHEEVVRAPLPDLRDEFARRAQEGSIKGEIAIVIDEPSAAEEDAAQLDAAEAARVRAAEAQGRRRAQQRNRQGDRRRVRAFPKRRLRDRARRLKRLHCAVFQPIRPVRTRRIAPGPAGESSSAGKRALKRAGCGSRGSGRNGADGRTRASACSAADERTLLVDGIEVRLSRKRVKNLNLRISRDGSHVDVSAPSWVSEDEVRGFVRRKAAWIESHLAQAADTPWPARRRRRPRRSPGGARPFPPACQRSSRRGAHHGSARGEGRLPQHDEPMGELSTFDGPHLHQCAPRALSSRMLGIRGGPRAVPLAGARPRSKIPPAHGRVYARLEAAPREAALRGCPFQRASRHARLCPRTRGPLALPQRCPRPPSLC